MKTAMRGLTRTEPMVQKQADELLDTITSTYCTLRDAVRRLKRADVELRRAGNADDPKRLNEAGTSYAIAKINLFKLVK